ncbi:MAG TPA: sulfate adenylyltransferase subunit CysN [Solirubrobacteraceae bacterium]|nr:sulfate adenylyltransferase subunit CysN [Solirubrobacteraceae bacterium]
MLKDLGDDIEALIHAHNSKTLVRFVMCGSVDDGKSTLIGRLLYESGSLLADQLAGLESESRAVGTQGDDLDFALLLDGLAAEREQGITIDVAYRHFSTSARHFIVADTPGHEQYTRNMVTGASTADCAVILIDARKGILRQTRRHSHLVALLGIRDVVLAVNKMDLVGYSENRFNEIAEEYRAFGAQIGLERVVCIPVSALRGDNVFHGSDAVPGYNGPTLMGYLESVEVDQERMQSSPFRMPVQWVNRPDLDFRGYAGTIAGGVVRPQDEVVVAPSGRRTRVERIVTHEGDQEFAVAGQSVTLTLADELDVTRGDVIAHSHQPPGVADQFDATIVWMGDDPMLRGRSYLMQLGGRTVPATINPLKHKLNVDTMAPMAATKLELNEIGVCDLELSKPIAFDPYVENRDTGGFILIDRITNNTVGAGMIRRALRRSQNVRWQALTVDKHERARQLHQQPTVLWLTGLPGSGKSTLANLVEVELHRRGHLTYLLDGDNVRHGLNVDLGFTPSDRAENIRRVAEVAHLMVDAGLIVIVSFISPFRAERRMARSLFETEEFLEIHVHAPLAVAEERDPKGLYRKARQGDLVNFTGIDSPYEEPESPELRIDTTALTPADGARQLIELLESSGRLAPPPQK